MGPYRALEVQLCKRSSWQIDHANGRDVLVLVRSAIAFRFGSASARTGRADPDPPSIVGRTTLVVCDKIGVEARITSTARKHKLSSSRIREALTTATFVEMDGDMAMYVGTDARGLVVELGIVGDDRGEVSRSFTQCRKDGEDERQ